MRNWCNYILKDAEIGDLEELTDGVLLASLVEALTGQQLIGIEKSPRIKIQKINNVWIVLTVLKGEEIQLDNHSAEGTRYSSLALYSPCPASRYLPFFVDLVEGKVSISPLIWKLILKYQLGKAKGIFVARRSVISIESNYFCFFLC